MTRTLPVSTDPYVNGIDKIRYIDETTDDEGGEPTARDRLLPTKPPHATLPEVAEEESKLPAPEPETRPSESSTSGESQTSLSTDVMKNLDKKMANGGSSEGLGSDMSGEGEGEGEGKGEGGGEGKGGGQRQGQEGCNGGDLSPKGVQKDSIESAAVTRENGVAQS